MWPRTRGSAKRRRSSFRRFRLPEYLAPPAFLFPISLPVLPGCGLPVPLFTAGRLSSNLYATEARAQQSLIQYRQSIQQAFKEVDDALVFHQKARQIRLERERQVEAAQQALALANLRYTNGVSSYLDVLDTERQLFSAEINLASITRDQLNAVVRVYRALGGGWEAYLPAGRGAQP